MPEPKPILHVYSTGPTTVVGFGGEDVLDSVNLVVCRDEMLKLIEVGKCRVLAFDLTGVKLIPSGLLGLLTSVRQHGVEVHLYNPSEDVRDVLSVTNLDKVMPVYVVEVNRPDGKK